MQEASVKAICHNQRSAILLQEIMNTPTQEMHKKKIFIISIIFLMDKHDEIVWGRKVKKDLVMKENSILR